ncbi:hypothetical protein [Nonomuraea sp. NPDC049646]|uniref:hypothetical protein n=1 Tax=unclassified Nonomuraea TaxID=2593643 RepID=UPI0037B790A8
MIVFVAVAQVSTLKELSCIPPLNRSMAAPQGMSVGPVPRPSAVVLIDDADRLLLVSSRDQRTGGGARGAS